MNAPEAGTIKEFLANEEDTVTVGQDLVKLEIGGAAGGNKQQGSSEPKTSASEEQATSSDPQPKEPEPKKSKEPRVEKEDKPASQTSSPHQSPLPTSEHHQAKKAPAEARKAGQPQKLNLTRSSLESQKDEPSSHATTSGLGNRDERRVNIALFLKNLDVG